MFAKSLRAKETRFSHIIDVAHVKNFLEKNTQCFLFEVLLR